MQANDKLLVFNEVPQLASRLVSYDELSRAIWIDYNVQNHGVIGDGITDDRPALQALIDKVRDEGGGILFFPPGVYSLGIVSDDAVGGRIALRMYGNVKLFGLHRSFCTIKLADGQAPFRDIISHYYKDRLENVEIAGITFDHNCEGNPITSAEVVENRMRTIGCWTGRNIGVTDCRFTNFESMNNIMLSGEMSNLTVARNLFDNINALTTEWHDYSAVYLKCYETEWFKGGSGMWVYENAFRPADPYAGWPPPDPRGMVGAHTAIETHGSNALVHKNLIEDFQFGMIITGERTDRTEMVSVKNNHVRRCRVGMQLWSRFASDLGFTEGPGVRGCEISGNHFTIDLDAWEWFGRPFGSGVMIPDHNTAAIYDLMIHGNFARYLPYTISPNVDLSNCITALNSQADQDKNWMIVNNILRGSPGNPVRIDPTVENLVLDNNI